MIETPTPKVLVCLFAHPDDEAFGPGGSIAHYSQICDVHLICVTDGGAGQSSDPGHLSKLAQVREQELANSSKVLGVKSLTFLNFADGSLNNNNYHQVADHIKVELDRLQPDTIMTFDLNGISGHLDHVAIAMISSYLWERNDYIKTIMYFCETKANSDKFTEPYFVYSPPGRLPSEIDFSLDVSHVFETKIKAMRCHISQSDDCDFMISTLGDSLKTEHFQIKTKL